MNFYGQVNTSTEIRSKTGIIPSLSRVMPNVKLHQLNLNERPVKKAWWKLPTDAVCCFQQILEAALHKIEALGPLTSNLTSQVRRVRHVRLSWWSKDELVCDVLKWTLTDWHTSVGWLAKTNNHQLCANTWYRPEDLIRAITDRDGWRERIKRIPVVGLPWWWWWWCAKSTCSFNRNLM